MTGDTAQCNFAHKFIFRWPLGIVWESVAAGDEFLLVPINALTGGVGPGTKLSGSGTESRVGRERPDCDRDYGDL